MASSTSAPLTGIYAIVNEGAIDPLIVARGALAAGVRIVQYRAKSGIVPDRLRALRTLTHEHAALLILNDDPEAARAFGCDGVHLGPDDGAFDDLARLRAARRAGIVGLSCGTEAEARYARDAGVDYVGIGAVFATASKGDAGAPIGVEGFGRVARAAAPMPAAAIGGVTADSLASLRGAGAAMAAVISAIAFDAFEHGEAASAQLVAAWNAV